MNDLNEKTCIACSQLIHQDARKCPHCRSWQYGKYVGWFHPTTMTVLALVLGCAILLPAGSIMYDVLHARGTSYESSDSISIVDSKVYYSEQKEGFYVSCIGTLRNNSDVAWENLHFEVRFFDSAGKLIDTLSDYYYSLVVRPHAEGAFRVHGRADKPADKYVTHKAEATWARDVRRSL